MFGCSIYTLGVGGRLKLFDGNGQGTLNPFVDFIRTLSFCQFYYSTCKSTLIQHFAIVDFITALVCRLYSNTLRLSILLEHLQVDFIPT